MRTTFHRTDASHDGSHSILVVELLKLPLVLRGIGFRVVVLLLVFPRMLAGLRRAFGRTRR